MFIKAFNILLTKTKDGRSPIYPGSIVEVEDEVGRYFVSVKSAQEITYPAAQATNPAPVAVVPGENPSESENVQKGPENAENGPVSGHLDGEQLQDMSFADLKALANDMGINAGKIRSKAALIAAISAVEVLADAEDPEEAPPVFDAQDVIEE